MELESPREHQIYRNKQMSRVFESCMNVVTYDSSVAYLNTV